ncbi:putative signal peptide protein [Novosphingobium aromaticivorans DSM 12444]|uniref:Putative signal peptide protein n=1 Tax=Novosphingobium aromaticivorans (strain ATCC 700278 / DSM 12444 / CCUG 56034 / CIP 105152 / NBRC 16084 / F199) TaxID=279238 RepID=Q2G7W2_NOVAD|nr:endo alpha-1,4 polygalactosaminidase [Novosphingobium aromaticivorans]ABD26061.1 putative signal peptide protein [Novosphingobium aromaticivorans DSM 12444]SCY60372.1 extracellular protein [Novosphingobium aromaticivorans]
MMGPWFDRRRVIAALAASPLAFGRLAHAAAPWRWAVDYGAKTDPALARQFDLLVLEPDHARPIEALRGPGAKLLGYLSLGEVEQARPYVGRLRKAGALIAANPNWPDARMVDLRHALWTSLVVEEIIPAILAKGYDGIFFDTLDNAEAMQHADPVKMAGMVDAAAALVRAIRARFPPITLMMNRGYALLPAVAPHVDVVLGEAMASKWDFAKKAYVRTTPSDWEWQAARLREAKLANPALRLTVLDYWDEADRDTVAALYHCEREAGFHPYVATLALDRIHPELAA